MPSTKLESLTTSSQNLRSSEDSIESETEVIQIDKTVEQNVGKKEHLSLISQEIGTSVGKLNFLDLENDNEDIEELKAELEDILKDFRPEARITNLEVSVMNSV
jgi:hypothetical protein